MATQQSVWGIDLEQVSYSDPPNLIKHNGSNWFQQNDPMFRLTIGDTIKSQMELHPYKSQKSKPGTHQYIVPAYLGYNSIYRGALLYYDMGTGKSRTSILWCIDILTHNPNIPILAIMPASLIANYRAQIDMWGGDMTEVLIQQIKFIAYNGRPIDQLETLGITEHTPPENCAIIIDEAHGLINRIKNVQNKTHVLYKILMNARNCKILALSGTPIVNEPIELALLMNIIKGKLPGGHTLFPTDMVDFTLKYLDTGGFKDSITGLVLHYELPPTDPRYPTVTQQDTKIPMSELQYGKYITVRERELEREQQAKWKSNKSTTDKEVPNVRQYTRTVCNFVFPSYIPYIANTYIGKDPITEKDVYDFHGVDYIIMHPMFTRIYDTMSGLIPNITSPKELAEFMYTDDYYTQLTDDDIINLFEIYRSGELSESEMKQKIYAMFDLSPEVFTDELENYSPKFRYILDNAGEGIVFCYSFYRTFEGIELLARTLEANGYERVIAENINEVFDEESPRFIVMSGESTEDNMQYQDALNNQLNMGGDYIKFVLGTGVVSEGVSFHNVQKLFIVEPHWNVVRREQIIGRTRRIDSHIHLPKELQHVEVENLLITFPDSDEPTEGFYETVTTDEYIDNLAKTKSIIPKRMLEIMKDSSVDKLLHTQIDIQISDQPSIFYPYGYVPKQKQKHGTTVREVYAIAIGSKIPIKLYANYAEITLVTLKLTGKKYNICKAYLNMSSKEYNGYIIDKPGKLKRLITDDDIV